MGNRRMGLGRMEKLMENLKRDLAMGAGSGVTGLEQVGLAPSDAYGVYEAVYEIDLGAVTMTATDNGLIKTVATVPANCLVLACHVITSEVFSDADTSAVDLCISSTSPAAADTAMTSTGDIIASMDLGTDAKGAIGSISSAVFSGNTAASVVAGGAGTHLCLINNSTGNATGTAANTSGKIVIYIKYIGSAKAVANTSI